MATGNFGERLRREREMREVSIEEIVKSTRISRRYLEALEREDWEKLPGGVFARGFVRTVARYLGLDEESLLGEFDLARKAEATGVTHAGQQRPHGPDGGKIPSGIPRWLSFALFVLILAGIAAGAVYGWRRYAAYRNSLHRTAQPHSSLPAAVPTVVASKPAAAPATAGRQGEEGVPANAGEQTSLELSISTSAATRVRVAGDGATIFEGDMPAGQNLRFRAAEQFEVTAADSSAVLLELNGQVMPPIGAPGASGTIRLSRKDLKQAPGGTSQP
jgi:cytoskeleton protein RodZ